MLEHIEVFKQSSVRINKDIYIDPYKINDNYNDAKYIFITHNHYDHYSKEDIDKVVNSETIFIMPLSMKGVYLYSNPVIFVEPNLEYEVGTLKFSTIPMYNINKDYHKIEYGWCGYNININNEYYYFMGDTDDIPEMVNIKCDYLFIPIGGTYTMTLDEALECMKKIEYKFVIPYHYGIIVGEISLGDDMRKIIGNNCIVKIK